MKGNRPSVDMPDPQDTATTDEFILAMGRMKSASQLTFRQLEERAAGHGDFLSRSTMADTLKRSTLPRLKFVVTFVRACGGSSADVHAWAQAHRRLAAPHLPASSPRCPAGPSGAGVVSPPSPSPATGEARYPGPLVSGASEPVMAGGARSLAPGQLPPIPGAFFGREAELASLEQAATSADRAGLIVLTGMAGIGKTGLAVRFAHRVTDWFGDGQLYLDLRGHSPEPAINPIEAMGRLMRGLGLEPGRMPATVEESTAQYRSLVAGRKLLILLDNAASVEQVRPLLPGAPGCLTLVTSRRQLSGLLALEGAHRIELGVLPADGARALLTRLLGPERVRKAPGYTSELVEACAGLPLALRIAAAQLADEPWRCIRDYVTELKERGLAVLTLDDNQGGAVSLAFDMSYERLGASERRLFRLLGLVPGPDFTVGAAAAMTGTTYLDARALIRSLIGANLLDEYAPGRYRFHDLLREYARHRAEAEDTADVRAVALDRLCAWYYQAKKAATALLVPWRLEPLEPLLPDDIPTRGFTSERAAVAWLEAEFDSIVAAVHVSPGNVPNHWAWHLASGAVADMQRRGRRSEVLATLQKAAEAARSARERRALAVALAELCLVCTSSGLPVSDEHLQEMLSCAAAIDDRSDHAYFLYVAGVIWKRLGALDRAAEYLDRALAMQEAAGEASRRAMTLLHLGNVTYSQGDLHRSAQALERLLEIPDELPSAVIAPALVNLSHVALTLGRVDQVSQLLDRAEKLLGTLNEPAKSCVLAYTRGGWYRDTGRLTDALEQLLSARKTADDVNVPRLCGHTRNELGFCRLALGDVATARAEFEQVAESAHAPHLRPIRSHALRGLAVCGLAVLELGDAQARAWEAVELARGTDRQHEAEALIVLARIELAQDRPGIAIVHGERALAIHRETGHYLGQAHAHRALGETYRATGDSPAARQGTEHLSKALRMLRTYGSPEAEEVHGLLNRTA